MAQGPQIHEPTVKNCRLDPRSDHDIERGKRVRGRPFLKWAGGKGKLLETIFGVFPSEISVTQEVRFSYVEGFLGSGALLFELLERYEGRLERVVANDVNQPLVNVYRQVRDHVDELIVGLSRLRDEFNACTSDVLRSAYFYEKRTKFNELIQGQEWRAIECACLFIFLNKTCYNGMYRVNRAGAYNVPFGKYRQVNIFDEDILRRDSELLRHVDLHVGSYEALKTLGDGRTLWYFDPPYRPLNTTSSFTAYAPDQFDDVEQEKLAAFCQGLPGWVIASNSIHPSYFRKIYGERFRVDVVETVRTINSKAEKRGCQEEVLIRNFGLEVARDI